MIKKDKYRILHERIRHELPHRYGITPTIELAKEWGVSVGTIYEYGRKLKMGRQHLWRYRGPVIIRNAITHTEYERVPFNGKNERKAVMDELYERYRVGIATGYYAISVII